MGSEVQLRDAPIFPVRAVGSFEQKPGCPADALERSARRAQRLCQGECYHPADSAGRSRGSRWCGSGPVPTRDAG